jgi:hypothetical protein
MRMARRKKNLRQPVKSAGARSSPLYQPDTKETDIGQALETVERYMDALIKKHPNWRDYVTDDVTFVGPIAWAKTRLPASMTIEENATFAMRARPKRRVRSWGGLFP